MIIYPDWIGREVVVMGSGASAAQIAPHVVGRFPIIATNLSFRLAGPECVLYAADAGFWATYADAREHPGLKVAPTERARQMVPTIITCEIATDDPHRMRRGPVGTIGHGGNSGYQAVNLAAQWGARVIYLAGLDYCGGHWHEDHPARLRNPPPDYLDEWAAHLDAAACTLAAWGIEVINLSSTSTLRAFPYADCTALHPPIAALSARRV